MQVNDIIVSVVFLSVILYKKNIVPQYFFFHDLLFLYLIGYSKIELKIQFKAGREKIILTNQF